MVTAANIGICPVLDLLLGLRNLLLEAYVEASSLVCDTRKSLDFGLDLYPRWATEEIIIRSFPSV